MKLTCKHGPVKTTGPENKPKIKSKGRRRLVAILLAMFVLLCVVGFIHLAHALTVDRKAQYTELAIPTGHAGLEGYSIAFITDTHNISDKALQEVVEELNRREVDLLLLGGDFAGKQGAWNSMAVLAQCSAPDGVWAVEGNHDNWKNLTSAMNAYGVHPLDNSGTEIQPGLYLAGVADLWNRTPDVEKAIGGAGEGDFVLLVSHNPDLAMLQDMTGVNLVLSGHTHGGQVAFFGLIKPLLYTVSDYGHRFGGGWATGNNGVPVYVSRGTGVVKSAPRVFSPPEVVILTLKEKA